jgi:redox-sensitive bicupin YhaK (pirin superfamily)
MIMNAKSKPIYQELYRKYIRQASKDGVNIRIIAGETSGCGVGRAW